VKIYSIITVSNREHVICESEPRQGHKQPNYFGTGKSLCGVLKKGETLEHWKKRLKKKRLFQNE
jgi:hypothetical protein